MIFQCSSVVVKIDIVDRCSYELVLHSVSVLWYSSELNSKLQDTLEMIDESMDVALSKTCGNFDDAYYSRIQTAYQLLGKTQACRHLCLFLPLIIVRLNCALKSLRLSRFNIFYGHFSCTCTVSRCFVVRQVRLCSIFVSYSKVEVNNCRDLLQFCFIAGYKNAMY